MANSPPQSEKNPKANPNPALVPQAPSPPGEKTVFSESSAHLPVIPGKPKAEARVEGDKTVFSASAANIPFPKVAPTAKPSPFSASSAKISLPEVTPPPKPSQGVVPQASPAGAGVSLGQILAAEKANLEQCLGQFGKVTPKQFGRYEVLRELGRGGWERCTWCAIPSSVGKSP